MRKLWTLMSSRRVRGVVAVVALAALGVAVVNLDRRTLVQRADAWAAVHAKSDMTLEELAAYPKSYRQPVFDTLPSAVRSRLWKEQFQRVLDAETDLNVEQREFIHHVMALVTPASFEKDAPKPEVCGDIARLFPNKTQRDHVRLIAEGITPVGSFGSRMVFARERLRSIVLLRAAEGGEQCNCADVGLCDCILGVRGQPLSTCTNGECEQTSGCGCIWGGTCNKVCGSSILMRAPAPGPTTK